MATTNSDPSKVRVGEDALGRVEVPLPHNVCTIGGVIANNARARAVARRENSYKFRGKETSMNIGGLVGALLTVFFVLSLGYLAGKRNALVAAQAAGFSKLALSFALPASLLVSMTDIRRGLLLHQGRLVLALLLAHVGLFVVACTASMPIGGMIAP